jgi:tRNA pseudouridine(38-40) synthase
MRRWSWQPDSPCTVEGTLQRSLQALVGPGSPRVVITSAGRTDRGVSACGQVVSFYARTPQPLSGHEIAAAITTASPVEGALRVLGAQPMPRSWHPTFAAQVGVLKTMPHIAHSVVRQASAPRLLAHLGYLLMCGMMEIFAVLLCLCAVPAVAALCVPASTVQPPAWRQPSRG